MQVYHGVKEAANRLDKKFPGWYKRVNTKRLEMMDWGNCVIGQMLGAVHNYCEANAFVLTVITDNGRNDYDFSGVFSDFDNDWKYEINSRRRRRQTRSVKRTAKKGRK